MCKGMPRRGEKPRLTESVWKPRLNDGGQMQPLQRGEQTPTLIDGGQLLPLGEVAQTPPVLDVS